MSSTVTGPDILSRTTTTAYSPDGRFPVESRNALGHRETRTFDPRFGGVASLTGPNGYTTTWAYDGLGRQLLETRADGTTTATTYGTCDGSPGPASACPPYAAYFTTTQTTGSAPLTVYHDTLNRVLRRATLGFDGRPVHTDTQYNALGQITQASQPYYSGATPAWSQTTYDLIGRPLTITAPDGTPTRLSYSGTTTATTNALNQTTTQVKNSQGQLIQVVDALGAVLTYTYDPFGNLTETRDPAGHVTRLSYDLRGRKLTQADPDLGQWTYTYNALGELLSQTDAKGQTTTLAYDLLGRLIKRTEPEGTSTWGYDSAPHGIGKLALVTGPHGYLRTHTYDVLGRPANVTTQLPNTRDGTLTRYYVDTGYDTAGRLETILYHTGFAVRQVYNAHGYLSEIRNSQTNHLYWQAQALNAQGNLTQALLGNTLTTVRTYDTLGHTTAITTGQGSGSSVQYLTYTYDPLGNLTERRDANQALSETFTYDALNRLTQSTVSGVGSQSVQYDALGNITYKSDVGSYTYGTPGILPGQVGYAGPHAVTAINPAGGGAGQSYTYDANGNLTSGGGRTLAYTSANLPSQISQGAALLTFSYDPERVRTRQAGTPGTTVYIHPRLDLGPAHFEEETQAGVTTRKHYINAGSQTVALYQEKSDGTTQTRYLHHDHLGSLDTVTDETGNVIERLSFDAWGKRRTPAWQSDPGNTVQGQTTTRGFTNHEHLDSVGLIHMNGRVYDPTLGRFLSADPYIQAPQNLQSYNRYSYVNNNPLSYTDPSGYFFKGLRKLFKSKVVRIAVAIAVAAYVGPALSNAYYASATSSTIAATGNLTLAQSIGIATTSNIVGGAAAGFAAGGISGGNLRSAVNGAVSGGIFAGVNAPFGDTWNLQRVAANSVAGGLSSELQGGQFKDGFKTSFITSSARAVYNNVVGADPNPLPGENRPDRTIYRPDEITGRISSSDLKMNVFGNNLPLSGNFLEDLGKQGSPLSVVANLIPGANAVAVFHDTIFNANKQLPFNAFTNYITQPPAAILTYAALINGPLAVQLAVDKSK